MKAFVTGATGFIGRRLVVALLEKGYEVAALVRPDRGTPDGLPAAVKRVPGDIRDREALRRVEYADVVFHLAGVYELGPADPKRMEAVNVGGTRNVLDAAAEGRFGLVVHVSSQVVLGPSGGAPVVEESVSDQRFRSEYERTKWLAHREAVEAAHRGVRVRIALPGAVYGPEDPGVLGTLLKRMARGRLPAAAFPDTVLSPVHVDDVVDGLIRIAEAGRDGESYLLAGEPVTQRQLLTAWAKVCGRRVPWFAPDGLLRLASGLLGWMRSFVPGTAFLREVTAMSAGVRWAAEAAKARRDLGWQPRPLGEGLQTMAYEARWPTHGQTWLSYFHVGRWNYLKGTAVAVVLAAVLWFLWGWVLALVVLAGAPVYVVVSGIGLYLLYGHPAGWYLRRLFRMAGLQGNERVADVHFGTYRGTRAALACLPGSEVRAVAVYDPKEEVELAVRDVWKFEQPPVGHPRLKEVLHGRPDRLPLADGSVDVVLLGFGIHEVHRGAERDGLMRELKRVLAPGGRVLLFERGWNPLLLLIFGPLFLHFTPGGEWERWFREHFTDVKRSSAFGVVDLFVASGVK
jgi:dihydroflavonol-4-reductase